MKKKNSGSPPTIYNVAELASVSIATVSRVINTPDRVRESTRNKVLKAIDALGFVPDAFARERARKDVGHIGVITPFFTIPSITKRLSGIANKLVNTTYNLTIFPVDSQKRLESYYAELPYTRLLSGLIILTLPIDETVLQRFKKNNIPLLLVENHIDGYSSIEYDNKLGGKIAAEHFVSKGYKQCAYIGNKAVPGYTLNQEEDRLLGYKQALTEHNIDLPESYIKLNNINSPDQDQIIHELLDLESPPTAIFTSSDELALRVLKVAKNRGVRIPQDLALIGFDNIEMASYHELTTISQSLYKSGELAAERIIALIADPKRPAENSFIRLKLVERSTT